MIFRVIRFNDGGVKLRTSLQNQFKDRYRKIVIGLFEIKDVSDAELKLINLLANFAGVAIESLDDEYAEGILEYEARIRGSL